MQFTQNSGSILLPGDDGAVAPGEIARFLGALFGEVEWEDGQAIGLRGLGEKGTDGEGVFREMKWVLGTDDEAAMAEAVTRHVERWNGAGHGAFLIPAILRTGAGEDLTQKEADVAAFTSVCVDLDDPATAEAALTALEGAIGVASIVVESSPGKRHAYWLLNEPETDVAEVARMRHMLALKAGGDPSFGRIPQVIRIPGSVHGKGGVRTTTQLLHCDTLCRHSFDTLAEAIFTMQPPPYRRADAAALERAQSGSVSGRQIGFAYMSEAASGAGNAAPAGGWLTETITEGGTAETNRHTVFGQVAGHYIHAVRVGELTLEEARERARGWMLAHMVPPWPDARFAAQWGGVLRADEANHGPLNEARPLFNRGEISGPEGEDAGAGAAGAAENPMLRWAAHRWARHDITPVRRWAAKGLVRVGASHVLAAEGGVGKTFALLDLAMKIAAPRPGDEWLGVPMDPTETGRIAVVITAEDDADELHIRMNALDPDGPRRLTALDRLIVIPLLQARGAFPLVEIGAGGIPKPSPSWAIMLERFKLMGEALGFVAIDTLASTLHGEENAALVLQQYITALNLVQGVARNAATMVTHHVRKQGRQDQPIQSGADMRNAVRGSNALLGAVRMVIGIWQPPDWQDQQRALGVERPKPNSLFHMAVVKGNNSEVMDGTRVLARAPSGGLQDVTTRVRAGLDAESARVQAWLLAAIRRSAEEGQPLHSRALCRDGGGFFPTSAQMPGETTLRDNLRALVEGDPARVVRVRIPKQGQTEFLDIPGGHLARTVSASMPYDVKPVREPLDWAGWVYDPLVWRIYKPSLNEARPDSSGSGEWS